MKNRSKRYKVTVSILLAVAILAGSFLIYAEVFYHRADEFAKDSLNSTTDVSVDQRRQ